MIWCNLNNMPLDSLPDLFDDVTHNDLDMAVETAVEDDLGDVSDLSSNLQYRILLNEIIAQCEEMNKKYLIPGEAKNLINTQEELRTMLASAWKRKSYGKIRNLSASLLPFVPRAIIYSLTRGC